MPVSDLLTPTTKMKMADGICHSAPFPITVSLNNTTFTSCSLSASSLAGAVSFLVYFFIMFLLHSNLDFSIPVQSTNTIHRANRPIYTQRYCPVRAVEDTINKNILLKDEEG